MRTNHNVLLIDLDGVLRRWRSSDEHIELAHGLPVGSIRRAAFATELLTPAITGKLSDEQWRINIADKLTATYHSRSSVDAVTQWSSYIGDVDQRVLATVKKCAPSLRVVLVTNATSRLRSDLQSLGLSNSFHAIVNSSEVGHAKPDSEIFLAALQVAGSQPEHALFVDDSQSNVQSAASLGILAHHFTGHIALADFLRENCASIKNAL
jgi:putative hydrolase of the HAD superfamily